ncbi:phospholipase C, phosphocholine-specific [Oleomonas cavernae]|uniref:phospholipase C n=1 Tax=Oleomonas cavernae TaxID=2320859 RepID=A0A418WC17_9PROT|nr:phospholipase C, phosphocholine-specific [Oleomonas cavernae]RJF87550.1 phospholipase C, phosphocholine-specific [Oleomonas cavernae]
MTDSNRRDFLKGVSAIAGMAATMSAFPPVIREALAIPANNATKSIQDVEHVVILMQENRSFDNYFGTMSGVRGFGDRFPIPLPGGRNVFQQSNGTRVVEPYHLDATQGNAQRVSGTPHSWGDAQAAWDNGRMAEWPRYKRDWSMGHYEQAELDFQYALANAFTLCDAYHCSLHGGTNSNRLFLWTGTNGPTGAGVASVVNEWDDLGPSSEGFTWGTYPERLQAAGVTWKVYQNMPDNFTDNSLHGFRTFRKANEDVGNNSDGSPYIPYRTNHELRTPLYKGCGNTMPLGGLLVEFKADIKAGRLPQVTWIVAPATYSEHPGPSSPVQGAWYIQETLNALIAYPEVWSKTALIINFDENDGFFDHLPPPALFSANADGTPAGASTIPAHDLAFERFIHPKPPGTSSQPAPDGRVYGPGPRVPCYVVSPWSRGGWVNSQVFDHTSVLRFLETRFGVVEPNISAYRRAICGDMTSAFNFLTPNGDIPALPSRSKLSADAIRAAQELRPQVPVPSEADQAIPQQETGLRLSRALPYELGVDATTDATRVRLRFRNTGDVGAVFHVYDQLHLDRVPRRYSVEANKQIAGDWTVTADEGKYDLWVLGPNGFHRHFEGDVDLLGEAGRAIPEVTVSYDAPDQRLNIVLENTGKRSCVLRVKANAYETYSVLQRLEPGQRVALRRSLKDHNNWYDYTVTNQDGIGFTRRFAGRMETGVDSVSDPANATVLASAQ